MILNNKGMAISGILYSILVLFIVLIFGVLSVLASTKYSFDKFRKDIIAKLSQEENIEEEPTVEYKEVLLNGTDPVLKNGMIPVKINNDGTVTRANLNESWYNYESKMWANMVLVDDSVRDVYMNYTGDEILDKSKILAYFVWIPRYRYKIPTGGTTTPSTIDIVFENKETNKSTGDAINNYFTHPAFTFGTKELNGIWVGKFQVSGNASSPKIIPNVSAFRSQTASSQFQSAQIFGNYVSNSDSHMMKNIDWGAAAYLSHSIYGINGQIRLNNNTDFITGCGAIEDDARKSSTCDIKYGETSIYPQSTTGDITGIFDMSGAALERIMAIYNNEVGESGFTTLPDSKYYDSYTDKDFSSVNKGDATYETAQWYDDVYSGFMLYSWLVRGASQESIRNAGAFAVGQDLKNGGVASKVTMANATYRVVITE